MMAGRGEVIVYQALRTGSPTGLFATVTPAPMSRHLWSTDESPNTSSVVKTASAVW